MGSYECKKWLRIQGFDGDHPNPDSDLGYAGRSLDIGELAEADTEEFDVYWQDPDAEQGWLIVTDKLLIRDLRAYQ